MKKIAVLGTGMVAQIIAEKLSQLGYETMVGTRDVQNTLSKTSNDNFGRPPFKEWQSSHPAIKLGTFKDAASFGELIVNATSGAGSLEALGMAGRENLANKVILDIANPLDFSNGMP